MKTRYLLILLISLFCLAPPAEARKVSTKHKTTRTTARSGKSSKKKGRKHAPAIEMDTICVQCNDSAQGDLINMIQYAGFDKKANSSKESFFISNSCDRTLRGIAVNLTYTTLDGRELHSRDIEIECEVPPGVSRNITIPAWDTQKSFYYHQSAPPAKGGCTPFEVTIHTHRFTLDRLPAPADSLSGH